MVEAISIILAMGLLVSLVAAVVGVIIGFRRKRWKLAMITGSVFGGLFVIFTIFMGATGQLDDIETESTPAIQHTTPLMPAPETTAVPQVSIQQESPPQTIMQSTAIPVPEPMAAPVSSPMPSVGGLSISRVEGQQSFESIGYEFEPTVSRSDGQPQTAAFRYNKKLMVVMTGPDDDLVTGLVSGDVVDRPDETAIAMALLAQTVMPSDFDSVVDWLSNTMTMVTDDPGRYMEKEFTQTYGDKHVTFSTVSTSLTGLVTFKIDSLENPVQVAETQEAEAQIVTELEFDCGRLDWVYWTTRDLGDHEMALVSVWDEMVRTNPNADFGVEAAARALEECDIVSP